MKDARLWDRYAGQHLVVEVLCREHVRDYQERNGFMGRFRVVEPQHWEDECLQCRQAWEDEKHEACW